MNFRGHSRLAPTRRDTAMTDKTKKALLYAGAGVGTFLAARALWRSRTAYSFKDRTVLITGGSRGLGLVLAREFAQEDAYLAICARDEDELHRAADDLVTRGARV